MAKSSKRAKALQELVVPGKAYPFGEAVSILKKAPSVKFNPSVEIAVRLGIDPRKSEQGVRGASVLPNGTGKTVRVAVFTQGANAEAAKKAGADLVGMDDLAQQIQAGNMNFDVVIASPDAMGVVGKLGQVLGPRGLMPNPKVGTVTPDISQAVKNAKGGQVRYRADKNGIVHCVIGKLDFEEKALKENLEALLESLRKTKPSSSKGIYIQKIFLSSTMGPGVLIDQGSITV